MPCARPAGSGALLSGCFCALLLAGCGDPQPPPLPNPHVAPAHVSGPDWKVTRRYTAHHALVIEVECRDHDRAVDIARELVEPVKDSYVEALVYVRPAGSTATRRVQWTRATGEYRVLDF